MDIYLVRHTTPAIEKGICYGQTDLDLALSFDLEADKILQKLPQYIDAVYCSPLDRCLQLAKKISPNPQQDNRLKELNFGDWEMQPWDNIPLQEIQPWYDDFVNTPTLNGESYKILYNRAIDFYKHLLQQNYQTAILVTHSGVIRSILSYLKNTPLKDSFDEFKIGYGEVLKVEA